MMGRATVPPWQQAFTTVGTTDWVVPELVTELSAVAIQAGEGGSCNTGGKGGNLRYVTRLTVTPGETLRFIVPAGGAGHTTSPPAPGHSLIQRNIAGTWTTIFSSAYVIGSLEGTVGGGDGGFGARGPTIMGNYGYCLNGGGGGGAGGYAGNGGRGGGLAGEAPTGGAGGGGGGGGSNLLAPADYQGRSEGWPGADGGGTGILGQGANGAAGQNQATPSGGAPGSGTPAYGQGGGGGFDDSINVKQAGRAGGQGAIRIIGGDGRMYPSFRTANE